MEEIKIHYRTGGKLTHAGTEMLPNGQDVEVIIEHIEFCETHEISGRKENNVWVCYFHKNPYTTLPIVLNSTNRKRLSKLAKTNYLVDVKNFPVRMTKEMTRDVQDGGQIEGLRISKIPAKIKYEPTKKETLKIGSENFNKCLDAVKSGYTVEQLRVKYDISNEVEKELLKK